MRTSKESNSWLYINCAWRNQSTVTQYCSDLVPEGNWNNYYVDREATLLIAVSLSDIRRHLCPASTPIKLQTSSALNASVMRPSLPALAVFPKKKQGCKCFQVRSQYRTKATISFIMVVGLSVCPSVHTSVLLSFCPSNETPGLLLD